LAAVAGGAVAVAAVGGIAWGVTAAPSAAIKACYQKINGQLRIVDSLDQCNTSEQAI
jgi:hypothetical protein